MPTEPTVEQALRAVEERHTMQIHVIHEDQQRVIGIDQIAACAYCTLPGASQIVRWPCDAIKLTRAVRVLMAEARDLPYYTVLAALRGED